MTRKIVAATLFLSTVALARETTVLDQLRYSMYRLAAIPRGIPMKSHLDNVDLEEASVFNRIHPYAGEEGQFTGVRFTPQRDMAVQEIDFTAPNNTKFGVNCTVSDDRIVNLYIIDGATPDNNALPDVSVMVPGQPGVVDDQVIFTAILEKALWVKKGESIFVAIEHPGTYPNVGCLTTAALGPDLEEKEFWSYATDVPMDWTGYEDIGIYESPLVSVSGYVVF